MFGDEQPLRPAVADLLAEKPADRRPPPMPDEGAGRETQPIARGAESPAEIHVVARGVKLRIETADGIEGGLA